MATHRVFLCSCAPDGGIFRFDLAEDGTLALRDSWRADRPMYAIRRGALLYALLLAPVSGRAESAAVALRIAEDGSLSAAGGLGMLGGECACHLDLSPSGRFLYAANYASGSLSQLALSARGEPGILDLLVRHRGSGPDAKRQEGPHVHYAGFTPDGKFLCAVDLGTDAVFLYEADPKGGIRPRPFSQCSLEPGVGPRHLAFSRDGRLAFCANELRSSVTVLRYRDGRLEPVATYPTLPSSFTAPSWCAAVRVSPDGRHLYVSNRGHQSIACFAVEGERLRATGIVGCGGDWPRDFDLSPDGKLLVCANERSGTVTTFRVDERTGLPAAAGFRQDLPAALCVAF